ncbi:MAG TPA: DMT family transporter [Candidatus Limnocylindrales bacterium]|nr:DMT family transporter [Candidatus Limnocylindrales bacterium]
MTGVAIALLGAFGFAMMNVTVRRAGRLGDIDDGVFTTVVVNIAVFGSLIVLRLLLAGSLPVDFAGTAAFVVAGLCSTFLGRMTLFGGIRRIGAARASAIKNATPLVTVAIAVALLGERPDPGGILGMAVLLSGIFLLVRETLVGALPILDDPVEAGIEDEARLQAIAPPARFDPEPQGRDLAAVIRRGIILACLSTLFFGTGHAMRKVGMDILPDAILGAAIGSATAIIALSLSHLSRRGLGRTLRATFLRPRRLFWLAGLMSCLGQICFFVALEFAPVSFVSVVAASETVLTVLLAALVMRRAEAITLRVVVPAALVFAGSAIIAILG